MTQRVGFARWRSGTASGGNRYDEAVSAGLRALGVDLRDHAVPGPWPLPGGRDRQQFAELLTREREWLVDNIVAAAAPESIAAATRSGRRVTVILHYFPADDPSLSPGDRQRLAASEALTVAAASSVVVTSAWAARQVSERYGRHDAVVAEPGVDPAPLAPGSAASGGPPHLLWLGRLTPGKDPLTFVDALARLAGFDWTARLVGPDDAEADLSRRVRDRLDQAGLTDRVNVPGVLEGAALESVWLRTDLLVHTGRHETYGMVVTEALARGIAAIVPAGTGAVEAQRVGSTFPPGDADALADELRAWLTDSSLRDRWRARAAAERAHLPTWSDAARALWSVLAG